MFCRLIYLTAACLAVATTGQAQQPQNDSDDPSPQSAAYAEIVRADQPFAYWRFEDGKGTAELSGSTLSPKQVMGGIKFGQPGPRRDKFPLFDGGNQGILFEKPGSLRYDDPGLESAFDFAAGDAITLEAWVSPTRITSGQQVYIIGKGRTGNKGFAAENQNWALRLVGK